jgi:hypothetical protein
LGAEQPAFPQNRHDQVYKVIQASRYACADDEPVGRFLFEPLLQEIRHFLRRADERRSWRSFLERHLAQRQVLFLRPLLDAVRGAAEAVRAEVAQFRERLVKRVLGEIMVFKVTSQVFQCLLGRNQLR